MRSSQFPTFRKWSRRINERLGRRDANSTGPFSGWLRRRGPTWRISTWFVADSRQAQQHSLLRLLRVAHQHRLELTPLVANLAHEHRGSYRRTLRRLAKRLAAGTQLVDALEQTPEVLSDSDVLAIRFGSQSGVLSSTYQQLLESPIDDVTRRPAETRHLLAYWMVPGFVLVLLLSLAMFVILPTFVGIAAEFGVLGIMLPPAFLLLQRVLELLNEYAIVWLLLALAIGWLIVAAPPRRFFRRALATRFLRPVAQRRSIELLRLFSSAVDAGRPLPGALSTLARYHFDKHLRQKLLYARNEVEQGVDVWRSLADAKLLTTNESEALAKARSGAVQSWTLRRLAKWKLAALDRRTAILFSFLHPILVLIFGSIVLLVCYALFGFLTNFVTVLA